MSGRYFSCIEAVKEMAALFKTVGIAFAAVAASLLLRSFRPELSMQIALAAGVLILILMMDEMKGMSAFLQTLYERTGIEKAFLQTVLKVLGIAYIAQFASDLCRDAGEGAVAGKVELAGRVMILLLCLPVFASLVEIVGNILSADAL